MQSTGLTTLHSFHFYLSKATFGRHYRSDSIEEQAENYTITFYRHWYLSKLSLECMIMCHLVCVGLYCAARDSVRQSIGQANARDEYSKEQIDNSLVMCCCEVKGGSIFRWERFEHVQIPLSVWWWPLLQEKDFNKWLCM